MTVGSLFSGIGGLDLGLERAGMRVVWQCESDEWRRGVLAERFPGVPCFEDVRDMGGEASQHEGEWSRQIVQGIHAEPSGGQSSACRVDLLCGGFPCQDLSVAGRRAGFAGERSSLFFEFARIAESLRPRWLLVENVPGLFSSHGGRDFGELLGTLADIGYGLGWRVVDSRYFGVPQRRRRVFIVGALADGDPRAAAERCGEILAVGTRCKRHPATGTEAGADVALASLSGLGSGGPDDNDGQGVRLVSLALNQGGRIDGESETFVAQGYTHSGGATYNPSETVGALTQQSASETSAMSPLVAVPLSHGSNPNSNMAGRRREDDENLVAFSHTQGIDAQPSEVAWPTLRSEGAGHGVSIGAAVRRLTPIECERLQAFPDGWTDLGPDSRRYAALGDAVTTTVSEWIGRRLTVVARDRNSEVEPREDV